MNPFRNESLQKIILSEMNPFKMNPFKNESLQKWIPSKMNPFRNNILLHWKDSSLKVFTFKYDGNNFEGIYIEGISSDNPTYLNHVQKRFWSTTWCVPLHLELLPFLPKLLLGHKLEPQKEGWTLFALFCPPQQLSHRISSFWSKVWPSTQTIQDK